MECRVGGIRRNIVGSDWRARWSWRLAVASTATRQVIELVLAEHGGRVAEGGGAYIERSSITTPHRSLTNLAKAFKPHGLRIRMYFVRWSGPKILAWRTTRTTLQLKSVILRPFLHRRDMADIAPEVVGDSAASTVVLVAPPPDAVSADAVEPVMSKEPASLDAAPVPLELRDGTAAPPAAAEASSSLPVDESPTKELIAQDDDSFWDDKYNYITPAGFFADARRNFWAVWLSTLTSFSRAHDTLFLNLRFCRRPLTTRSAAPCFMPTLFTFSTQWCVLALLHSSVASACDRLLLGAGHCTYAAWMSCGGSCDPMPPVRRRTSTSRPTR